MFDSLSFSEIEESFLFENAGTVPFWLTPFKLVSWLEMIKFHAANIGVVFTHLQYAADAGISTANQEFYGKFTNCINWCCNNLRQMGLTSSALHAERIKGHLQNYSYQANPVLQALARELIDTLHSELENYRFLMLPAHKARYYDADIPLFSQDVIAKLPIVTEDMTEAGNCFALNRYTACVFHLMRVMESATQAMGSKLGVAVTCDKDWQIILGDMRGELKKLYPSHKDADRIRYEGVIAFLETVKIAWRNPTMHPKATYTEEEAERIMKAVKAFMVELVAAL